MDAVSSQQGGLCVCERPGEVVATDGSIRPSDEELIITAQGGDLTAFN